MIYLNNHIKKLSDYPFERLRRLLSEAIDVNKKNTLDMSIGQPYHEIPDFVEKILIEAGNKWHLYPPVAGIKELRESYKNWLKRRFNLKKNFLVDEVLPLSGTREGLFSIAITLDFENVIVPNPFYQAYIASSLIHKSSVEYLGRNNTESSFFNLSDLEKRLSKKKSLVYLCSPSNPQGKIINFQYMKDIIKLIRKYNSVMVVDECYSDIYYHDVPKGAIKACEEIGNGLKNILIYHSLSKRSNVAGMRSGFVVGDKRIISLFKRLRSYSAPSIPIPIQLASAKLWDDDKHVVDNRKEYERKINYANKIFSKYSFYKKPEAGFYLWINVKDGEKFTKNLYSKYKIKVMPGKYLSKGNKKNPGKNFIRISLVHNFKKCKNAIDKIDEIIKCQ